MDTSRSAARNAPEGERQLSELLATPTPLKPDCARHRHAVNHNSKPLPSDKLCLSTSAGNPRIAALTAGKLHCDWTVCIAHGSSFRIYAPLTYRTLCNTRYACCANTHFCLQPMQLQCVHALCCFADMRAAAEMKTDAQEHKSDIALVQPL